MFSTNKDDQNAPIKPSVSTKGPIGFLIYALVLVFIHHFMLFFLEAFSFNQFFSTLARIFFSTLFTVLLIILGQLLFYKIAKK
jgi:hypothetical protein